MINHVAFYLKMLNHIMLEEEIKKYEEINKNLKK